jgi:uncharacterized cupredoxin-like copper-binding protein
VATHQANTRTTCRRRPALVAVALAGAALLAACGAQTRQAAAGAGTEVITVKAAEFAYSPSTIRVPAGRPVRLVLENAGLIEHDLTVVRLPATEVRTGGGIHSHKDEVAAHAAAGKRAWVEFTPTEQGTYDVECTVPGHKDAGMKGKLVVE